MKKQTLKNSIFLILVSVLIANSVLHQYFLNGNSNPSGLLLTMEQILGIPAFILGVGHIIFLSLFCSPVLGSVVNKCGNFMDMLPETMWFVIYWVLGFGSAYGLAILSTWIVKSFMNITGMARMKSSRV